MPILRLVPIRPRRSTLSSFALEAAFLGGIVIMVKLKARRKKGTNWVGEGRAASNFRFGSGLLRLPVTSACARNSFCKREREREREREKWQVKWILAVKSLRFAEKKEPTWNSRRRKSRGGRKGKSALLVLLFLSLSLSLSLSLAFDSVVSFFTLLCFAFCSTVTCKVQL